MIKPVAGIAVTLAALRIAKAWRSRAAALDALDGQVVLITGGSRGLGLALADEFAQRGCRIAICARDEDHLAAARARIARSGAEVLAVPCDVSEREAVERMVGRVTEHFGRIDIVVNNASVLVVAPAVTRTVEDFDEAMGITFWGTLYTSLAVLPAMRERQRGTIVNITSVGGKLPVPHLLPYVAAKYATVGLSQGLHAELAADGVSVVTVVPGLMRTGSYLNATFGGQHRREFTWFSVLGNTPIVSIAARRAARRIVLGTARRETEVTFTPLASIGERVHGLMPGVSTNVLAVVHRLLPGATDHDGSRTIEGWDSGTPVSESFVTELGRRAAVRFHQVDPATLDDGLRSDMQAGTVEPARRHT